MPGPVGSGFSSPSPPSRLSPCREADQSQMQLRLLAGRVGSKGRTVSTALLTSKGTQKLRWSSSWCMQVCGLSTGPCTERSPVQVPVRAHAWAVGQVPSWGMFERQPINISLPSPCENKFFRRAGVRGLVVKREVGLCRSSDKGEP